MTVINETTGEQATSTTCDKKLEALQRGYYGVPRIIDPPAFDNDKSHEDLNPQIPAGRHAKSKPS
ncbi:hypothetical protein KIN20_016852 [Parelaphostrongylus tenuis]|uniref:Uncharacterized protein n=1 Tax=Parelaphostrongylus tenuis TaxID=148309 RepID=A0AAD5MMB8_PARTN|nr:hypothetical protein KIN20_016852 [Parelaphostrongylus tenuis]